MAVLWNGGISFGGVLAFVFADLIILPILDIYRRYYGWRMALFLFGTFYATMATAGLVVEFVFEGIGLVRHTRNAKVVEVSVTDERADGRARARPLIAAGSTRVAAHAATGPCH